MCELIKELERITPDLPPIPNIIQYREEIDNRTIYRFNGGIVTSENLHSEEAIAIAKIFIHKGVTFERHVHPFSYEWLIILRGSLILSFDDSKDILLNVYDSINIDINKPHSAYAVEDTTIIAITIPKDDGFPK